MPVGEQQEEEGRQPGREHHPVEWVVQPGHPFRNGSAVKWALRKTYCVITPLITPRRPNESRIQPIGLRG